jgi:preprotein translocase subunit YajC
MSMISGLPGAIALKAFGSAISLSSMLGQADPAAGLVGGGAAGAGSSAGAAAAPGAASQGPAGWISWAMMLGVFAVFYFLVLRPQQKRTSQHKNFLDSLQVGANVVTTGGVYGKIIAIEDQIARIEIADRVTIRVHKSHVAGAANNAAEALAPR